LLVQEFVTLKAKLAIEEEPTEVAIWKRPKELFEIRILMDPKGIENAEYRSPDIA
jgi:hypothetical protein